MVPARKLAEQLDAQPMMPAGALVTVPPAEPRIATVNVKATSLGVVAVASLE